MPERKKPGLKCKLERVKPGLIATLLTSVTLGEAAQKVGLSHATVCRYLQDPEFKAEYDQARKGVVAQALAKLETLSEKAVEVLDELLKPGIADYVRLNTAKAALDYVTRIKTLESMQERLERLEKKLKEMEREGPREANQAA
ncbi:MAG: hypothetical protein JRJ29_18075 [Deltaproteobacteria bacterium]|nr:hypothetical protein [Deltaproteobacteria bacterium]